MAGRVVAYVDGFNLYHGLKEKHGRRYLWLDVQALANRMMLRGQQLVGVDYFSARIRTPEATAGRQAVYLDALGTQCPLLTLQEGRFQEKRVICRNCGHVRTSYEEKETDVSIAVALVEDAVCDRYDAAIVVSADSDLCPAVRAVRRIAPEKRILVAFPPRRVSEDLRRTAHGAFTIQDSKIRQCLLPESVVTAAGVVLERPERWGAGRPVALRS